MLNPEFRKNLWLELSFSRVAILIVILLVLFYLAHGLPIHFPTGPQTCYFFLVLIWGTKLTSQAISEEFMQNTWDSQRMSSINAWSMTWGKLFGSTAYIWIGGIVSLIAYAFFNFHIDPRGTIQKISLMLGAGLLTQAIAFVASLQALQSSRTTGRGRNFGYFILGILFSIMVLTPPSQALNWYGIKVTSMELAIASVFFLLLWTYIGAYRLMRTELQHRNGPIVWVVFLITMILFYTGISGDIQNPIITNASFWQIYSMPDGLNLITALRVKLLLALSFVIFTCYLMAFFESKSPILWRRILLSFNSGQPKRFFQLVPCWALSFMVCVILAFLIVFAPNQPHPDKIGLGLELAILLLFVLRDISIFVTLNLSLKKTNRVDLAAAFYILFSYAVLAGLFKHFGLNDVALLFAPLIASKKLGLQLGFIILENVVIWLWAMYRWRKLKW